ncbi:hypothetical protein Ancab_032069 [Ancistrocladus abbreviatus]
MGKTIQVSGFPCTVSAEAAKNYLEQYTGRGTVHALKMREFKSGTRSYAIVQFTTSEGADRILSLASTRLWYGSSYLKAWMMDSDIVPRPRTYQHSIHDKTLYFGCQISNDKFLAFRRALNVSFNIGFGQRKLHFVLTHGRKEYELELSFDDVWQIQLRHPHGHPSKYLLIQLFGAPRIYEKVESCSEQLFEAHVRVRTTDFTPCNCIGQSSVICLELPSSCKRSWVKENFAYYTENDGQFFMEIGDAFCKNQQLVPVIFPLTGVNLPYESVQN